MISDILIHKASVFTFSLHGPVKLQGIRDKVVFTRNDVHRVDFIPQSDFVLHKSWDGTWLPGRQGRAVVWQQGDKLLLSGRGAETHQGQGWKGQVKHSLKEDAEVFHLLIPAKTLVVYNCLEDMFHKHSQSLLECCEKWKSHLTLEACSSPSSSQPLGEPASLEAKYKE